MDKIVIARGVVMPFFPMRPARGPVLRNQSNVEQFDEQVLKTFDWIVQPKLEGDRACVATVDKKVYIQNRHGSWYKHPVKNLDDFKKLPNLTLLDGEVFKGNFYPFECLVSAGKSFVMATPDEREILAFQMSKFLGHEWKFSRPSKKWVAKLHGQMPEYGGVVLKRAGSPYIIHGSADQSSLDWLKKCWG